MPDTTSGSAQTRSRELTPTERFQEFIAYIPSGDTIPDETWRGRHRNILILLLAHVPFLLALGLYSGTESLVTGATLPEIDTLHVLAEVGVVVGLAVLARLPWFGRRTRTALATMGLVTTSGFLVHFSGGYIEAHFHFFVVMAVVAVYEDWLPFFLGIGYVSAQHGIFGMIDPSRVYNHSAAINNPWVWAFIHAGFVLMLAAALMAHWSSTERSREAAEQQLEQAREKTQEVENLEEKKAEMERTIAEAEEAKAEAEARQQEVEEFNEHLEATADAYSAAMSRAADGDLTVRIDPDSESDAMAQIAESFNKMMTETESAMAEIQTFSQEVASTSDQATAGANEATGASEDMSESIQGIASGAVDQREMLETVSSEMTDLSATVEEVAASAETVAERSRETAKIADDGEETAQEAIAGSREVQTAIDSTVENVERLDEKMAEIGEIVDLIGDIAEQTNMLALNANIEAARAGNGSGGDGFAVVADEVKQLAEETQASATEIEQLIAETQAQTETTVTEARGAKQDMQESTEAVEDVVDTFTQVAENAEATDDGIQEISDTTDDQAATTEEAVSMVEEAVDISEATAAETETASATAQEQAASMSQVSASIESLAEQSERLQTMLSEFEVDSR
ncbi:methyl-accepting chemotaxis protein [Haloarcula hispanica]|uniref:Methyl-accepting chemotaxis protein n=1 Tax=Haloarcula hispanica TaxID=51589 RepID=A0A482T588_HALHI|nr:methyl-accepting chemotaxis protein [Haloarcula hispanica]MCJ0618920.1 methyl-accepting chemotaxis protein [Haloarcula hispanica]RYJ09462.1 methyl-accepting chemotaxis protein [Haloarcula hispanica]